MCKADGAAQMSVLDLRFFMCKADTMYMGVGAPATQATLKEKGACAALFDVYLGKAPISAPAKDGIGNGFAKRIYAFDSQ